MIRRLAQRVGWWLLERRAPEWEPAGLEGTSIVFAPHYDDETLGAGAAILKLRHLGRAVHIAFMTDGSQSHAHAVSATDLSRWRRQEGLMAAAALGVDPSHVTFLEYPETRLARHQEEAAERVVALLEELDCRRVIVPSRFEPRAWSDDHQATTRIVFTALERIGRRCEVVEYLVWFWYHWPWVPLLGSGDLRQLLALSWQNAGGLRAGQAINTSVRLAEFAERKRSALSQHRTQMTRVSSDGPWPVLADVAGGEFLENIFRSREWFRISQWGGGGAG